MARPSGIGRMAIPGEAADAALVLSAVNAAMTTTGLADNRMIRNALWIRGDKELVPRMTPLLERLEAEGKVRRVGEVAWRPTQRPRELSSALAR